MENFLNNFQDIDMMLTDSHRFINGMHGVLESENDMLRIVFKDKMDELIERMENLYGKNIPDVIVKRYLREKNYLQLSEFQKEFRVFAELLLEMKKMKMVLLQITG